MTDLHAAAERLRENVYNLAGEQRLDDLTELADFALPLLPKWEAIISHCKKHCNSATNPEYHRACLDILRIAGERPEVEESK